MGSRSIPGGLQTVAAAFDLLNCFAEDEELGVTEVSRRLGIPKSSAHRLLTTLASRGVVEQNPSNSRYRLGLRLYELGNLALTRVVLRKHVQQHLAALQEASGLSVQFSIASGLDALVLERLQTLRGLRSMPDFERRLPLHVTAQGKILCAHDPNLAEARISAGLIKFTDHTITSESRFRKELAEIRHQGFSVATGEAVPDVAGIGVPVPDARGAIVAAVSIIGSVSDISPQIDRLSRLAVTVSGRIAASVRHSAAAK